MGFLSALRNDITGGTSAYKSFNNQRNAWLEPIARQRGLYQTVTGEYPGDSGGSYTTEVLDPQVLQQLQQEWLSTLDPVTRAQAEQAFGIHSADLGTINQYGSLAAKGIIGAAGAGAALTGAGLLGGTAGGGATGLDFGAAAESGTLAGGNGGAGSLLGGASSTFTSPYVAIPGATTAVGGGMDLAGLLSGAGSLKDYAGLLSGGAGLINALKPAATASTPDYNSLAVLQAQLNQAAADKALAANRPNQIDLAGNSLTWSQDPVTGKWTQTQKLSGANQQLLDTSQAAQLAALRGVAGRGDFNFQGNPLMSATGNSSDIQRAWMNLLQPDRDMARAGEVQRLKNQGLTEDSPAFQRAMLRLDQGDTDAQNKALIYGTQEYGNQFNRSLQGRQQAFGEYQTDYNAPMQQYQGLMGIAAPSGQFGAFTNASNPGGAQVYNAGQDQYAANLANANAKNAGSNNLTQGLFGLAGSIAKGGWGG